MNERKSENIDILQDNLMKQEYFMDTIRQLNDEYFAKTGKRKTYLKKTYGCQMNVVVLIFETLKGYRPIYK